MLKGFVDQINGHVAVIQLDEFGTIELPTSHLPKNIREGVVVSISVTVDQDETERRTNAVASIQDRLRKKST